MGTALVHMTVGPAGVPGPSQGAVARDKLLLVPSPVSLWVPVRSPTSHPAKALALLCSAHSLELPDN